MIENCKSSTNCKKRQVNYLYSLIIESDLKQNNNTLLYSSYSKHVVEMYERCCWDLMKLSLGCREFSDSCLFKNIAVSYMSKFCSTRISKKIPVSIGRRVYHFSVNQVVVDNLHIVSKIEKSKSCSFFRSGC